MKRFLFFGFLLLPFFGAAQAADTAAIKKEVDSLYMKAVECFQNGNLTKSVQILDSAMTMNVEYWGKENKKRIKLLNLKAICLIYLGKHQEAENSLLESQSACTKTFGQESMEYEYTIEILANLYDEMGRYSEAEPLYLECKSILTKSTKPDDPFYRFFLNNIGSFYLKTHYMEKAESYLLEAKGIWEKSLDTENEPYAMVLNNLGYYYIRIGLYAQAEQLLLQCKQLREKLLGKKHSDYAQTLVNLGILCKVTGRIEEAEALLAEAVKIKKENTEENPTKYALALDNLAGLYRDTERFAEAEKLYKEDIEIRLKLLGDKHKDYACGLTNLATLYLKMDRYRDAKPLYEEAEQIYLHALGKSNEDYLATLRQIIELQTRTNQFESADSLLFEVANTQSSLLTRAARYLSEKEMFDYSLTFERNIDKTLSYTRCRPRPSGKLLSICYDNTLLLKGFLLNAAGQMRRLAMQDEASAKTYNMLSSKQLLLSREYAKPISERSQYVPQWEDEANTLEKELVRTVPGYEEAVRPVAWRDVQAKLQPGEAAVEFVHFQLIFPKPTDSIFYVALVLLPGDAAPRFIPLCEQRQLDTLVPERRVSMVNYLSKLYASPRPDELASLYQLLWEPLEQVFREKGVKTVYYAPSGLLHRLNLGAIAPDKFGATLADKYHLILVGSTRQVPIAEYGVRLPAGKAGSAESQSALRIPHSAIIYGGVRYEMDSTAIASANATLLGAVTHDTTGGFFPYADRSGTRGDAWNYLPGTEKEANYLHDLLTRRGIKSARRLGYEATEESFKQIGRNAPSPNLLHISTHGFFFPDPTTGARSEKVRSEMPEPVFKMSEHPMIRSGLILAGANQAWEKGRPLAGGHEDGILTAYEVSQMNLSNTELVVLSACETGLGDIKGNEGVYGLQRAFRIAGAKNVLMSLWKVSDEATEKLMTQFYQNWLEQKMPLREAFEEAQKWLRAQKGYGNPYFWAGFVLIGE